VFVLSAGTGLLLPVGSALREIASIPAIAALVGALFTIFRDEAAFEKQQFLQRQQETFSLGTTSHMANVAFDKHVEFCEKYMAEVHRAVATLFREGPTTRALEHVARFVEIQRQYTAWIPTDVASELEPFENAVNRIGALSYLVDALSGSDQPGRKNAIDEMFGIVSDVLPAGKKVSIDGHPEIAVEVVKERIRAILGIEELTKIRRRLVQRALELLEKES
jgi:hypothetical protein